MATPKKKAKLTKDLVEVNLKGVEAKERRTRLVIPEGTYNAVVVQSNTKKFGTGAKGVVWVFEVTDSGKGKGSRFYYNTMLIDADGDVATNNLWAFRGVLQALKPPVKIADSMMKIPLAKMLKRTCALEIVDGEYEGKIRSEISDVFNQKLMEEDEDELDDDFEDEEEDDELEEEEEDEEEEDEDEIDLDEDEL